MWNRYKDTDKTTNRTKAIRNLTSRLDSVEEVTKEHEGILSAFKRGIKNVASLLK